LVVDENGNPVQKELTASTEAYLQGEGLLDGVYYYQVTDTQCRNLLAGPGAETAPDTMKKAVTVVDGKFSAPMQLMPFVEWYEDYEHADSAPWTYQVWLTKAPGFHVTASGCFGFDPAQSFTTTFVRRPIEDLSAGSLAVTDDLYHPVTGNVFPSQQGIRFYAVAPSGGYYYQVTDAHCENLLAGPNPGNGAPDTSGAYVNSYSGRLYSPVLAPFDPSSTGDYVLQITPVEKLADPAKGCFGFLPEQTLSVPFSIR
jgi:hypothetical protein